MVTPRARKGVSTSLSEPSQVSLYGKALVKLRVLRWNLPWIIQMGTKCNYKHPLMGEAERDTQGRQRQIRVLRPHAKGYWNHQKLEEARNGFPSGALGRSAALPSLGF